MNEGYYEYTDSDGDRLEVDGPTVFIRPLVGVTIGAHLPTDPAELHRLTEAILGRKVAAVIYEDELPEVEHLKFAHTLSADGAAIGEDSDGSEPWKWTRGYLAIARHIEARETANAEAERAVERKALELYEVFNDAQEEKTFWDDVREDVQEGFIAVARHELGARPPQGEGMPAGDARDPYDSGHPDHDVTEEARR